MNEMFNIGLARAQRTRLPSDTSPRGPTKIYETTGHAREKAEGKKEGERKNDGNSAGAARNALSLLHSRN